MNLLPGSEAQTGLVADPRLLAPFLVTGGGAALLWTAIYAAAGTWVPAVITAAVAAGFGIMAAAVQRGASLRLVRHLSVGIGFTGIFALVAVTGGYTGVVAPWLPVLAVFGAFLLSPRGIAGWGAALVLLTAALIAAQTAGVTFPVMIPEAVIPTLFALSLATAVAAGVILIYFFSRLQYRARASVAEGSRNLRRMLDAVPEPLVVFTPRPDGGFDCSYANGPMTRIVGRELSGRELSESGFPEPEASRKHLIEVIRAGRRTEVRRRVRLNGEERLIRVISQPLVERGEVRQVVTIVQDLTRYAETQKRLMHSARLASLGELVSGLAHEIRNPLMVIGGTADMMAAGDPAEELEEDLQTIRESTQRAARIVDGLMQFARQGKPLREAVDLNDVVRSVLRLRRQLVTHHEIDLRLRLAGESVTVTGDRSQLEQVVLHLLNNAERAAVETDGPERWVEVRTRRDEREVTLSVGDSGAGIPYETLSQVFDPFFTTRAVGDGTGLGLSISHGIVEEHGGSITVESPPGLGAVFSVTLPRATLEATPETSAEEEGEEEQTTSGEMEPTVLIADDEPHIRRLVVRYLGSRGYRVREAGDGEEALRMAEAEPFDAVILDWRMPGMGGREVHAQWKKERPALADRIVFVTGESSVAGDANAPAATGRPVLAKPFDLGDLEREIGVVVGGER